jgi:hypothetical protein
LNAIVKVLQDERTATLKTRLNNLLIETGLDHTLYVYEHQAGAIFRVAVNDVIEHHYEEGIFSATTSNGGDKVKLNGLNFFTRTWRYDLLSSESRNLDYYFDRDVILNFESIEFLFKKALDDLEELKQEMNLSESAADLFALSHRYTPISRDGVQPAMFEKYLGYGLSSKRIMCFVLHRVPVEQIDEFRDMPYEWVKEIRNIKDGLS